MVQDPTTTTTTTVGQTTTTTTTKAPTTTTTTTETPTTTTTTTEAVKRGEVHVDEDAKPHTLQEQPVDERLEQARNEALVNHAVANPTALGVVPSHDKAAE